MGFISVGEVRWDDHGHVHPCGPTPSAGRPSSRSREDGPRRGPRRHRRPRAAERREPLRPAGLRRTRPRWAGTCGNWSSPARGPGRMRSPSPDSRRPSATCRTAALVLLDGLIASAAAPVSWCRSPAGCGWWCSSTCPWATSPSPRAPSAPSSRAPVPSSPPARGRGSGSSAATRSARTGCRSPGPARTGATWRRARPRVAGSSASARWCRTRGRTCCSRPCAGSPTPRWTCTVVGSLDRDPAFVERLRRRRRRGPDPVPRRPRGRGSPAAVPGGRRPGAARRGWRRTAWSSRRPWRSGCPSSRPPSEASRRPWDETADGPPGLLVPARRPGCPRRGARRLAARRRPPRTAARWPPASDG